MAALGFDIIKRLANIDGLIGVKYTATTHHEIIRIKEEIGKDFVVFSGADEMEAIKRGYQENRRILIEGLPKAGLTRFLPADGAFYLYADVSDFTSDSFEFTSRMLEQAHVAATPGVDFDPIHGRAFVRFSYARSADEMREAVTRIARWLG